MSEEKSMEEIEMQSNLDNYFVRLNKGFEKQGGDLHYASTLNELAQIINQLQENQVLIPMKEALEKYYPIQSLSRDELLYDIADNYVLSYEMNQCVSNSLGVFQYQDEEVLLVGYVENDRLFFSLTDYYGYEVTSISEEDSINPDQVAILKGKDFEEGLLIDQGYIQPQSIHEYKNRFGEKFHVFNLTDKGTKTKQETKTKSQKVTNKIENGHRSQQRDMDI